MLKSTRLWSVVTLSSIFFFIHSFLFFLFSHRGRKKNSGENWERFKIGDSKLTVVTNKAIKSHKKGNHKQISDPRGQYWGKLKSFFFGISSLAFFENCVFRLCDFKNSFLFLQNFFSSQFFFQARDFFWVSIDWK